jgi:hypothetical protein
VRLVGALTEIGGPRSLQRCRAHCGRRPTHRARSPSRTPLRGNPDLDGHASSARTRCRPRPAGRVDAATRCATGGGVPRVPGGPAVPQLPS